MPTQNTNNQQNDNQPIFNIQRIYLKESSLEQPNSPKILQEQAQPTVDIQLNLANEKIADSIYEVTVTATVHTKVGDRTLFLTETKQAGIFELRNIPEEQLEQVLGIACPQIVYPYLRGNVADLINRAGFPAVHLVEINFQAMYQAQKEQQAAQAAQQNTGTTTIAKA